MMILKIIGDWIWKILGNIADFIILILSFQDGDLEGKNKKDSEPDDISEVDGLLSKTSLSKMRAPQSQLVNGLPRPHEGESTRRLRRNSANFPDSKKRKTVDRIEVEGKFGLASRSTSRDDPTPNAPGIALTSLHQFSSDPDAGIGLRGSKPLISLDRLSILSVPPQPAPALPEDISNNKTLPTFGSIVPNAVASKRATIPYNALDITIGTLSTNSTTARRPSYSLPFIKFSDIILAECIGNGGFGQVWKGNWKGTPVAVKMISHGGWSLKLDIQQVVPEKLIKGFEEEVNLLGKLRHPNICLLLGICIEANAHIMVTELVCRGSLWDQLRVPNLFKLQPEDRFFWPNWVISRVLEGTGRGLSYLHSCDPSIIHRDLKSANILVDESFNVKICDFGLAKLRDLTTVMTANVGTVQWMAPEVLQGHEYFESADMYSLGLVAWELLTGQCPYEGMKQMEIALNVVNYDMRPTLPATCTPEQYQFIQECWATNPFDRISAETFVNKVPHIFATLK